jgi:hypothetical protein
MNKAEKPIKGSAAESSTEPTTGPETGAAGSGERSGNVDKIRDILFGSQMRDYDTRFTRFEERLVKETAILREDLKRRLTSLEVFFKSELDALTDRQKAEHAERTEVEKELARELKESNRAWEKKAGQMEEQNAKALRELRQTVLDMSKQLSEEIAQKHQDMTSALGRESQELRAMLTDRLALADLFTEMAMRLRKEFEIPEKK